MPDDSNHDYEVADDFSIVANAFDAVDSDVERGRDRPGSTLAMLTSWMTTAHAADVDRGSSSSSVLSMRAYGRTWVYYVFAALVIALICNGIFGIPLEQVVDVNLALFLSWVAIIAGGMVIIMAFEVVNGDFRGAFESLLYIAAFVFLPFGAITGYMIYGWFGGGAVGDSFVYNGFLGLFVKGYTRIATVIGDVLGAVTVAPNEHGVDEAKTNANIILTWTQVAAGGLAAIDIVLGWIGYRGARAYVRARQRYDD